ncbi:hypothetical protein [Aquimarina longa]|uniref:hypothetical protein n=1 Tax=Aquimarina longa TaxID=1080221 RepID=UPI0007857496|nr:hypothetical protein [Aquimarina longa]
MKERNNNSNTVVQNDFNGWTAETTENYGGYDWKITTMKQSNGKIATIAIAGRAGKSNNFLTFETSPLTSPKVNLASVKANATEKKVRETHIIGLLQFDCLKEAEQLPINPKGDHKEAYKIEVGQVIFFNGYGQSESYHEKKVIYHINTSEWGTNYKYVNLKTLELGSTTHLEPSTEIFRIGTYYIEGEKINLDELNNILIEAKTKERKQQKKEDASKLLNQQLTNAKIEEGKKGLKIPKNVKAVIVAELMEDRSDSQTDYYHSQSVQTIYLAFSTHKRDLFNEMRKASLNSDNEEIRKFAIKPTVDQSGDVKTKENAEFWTPKDEHREKYSMGAGYYLHSGYSRSGWRISKEKYLDFENENTKNLLAIANAEGRYFCQVNTKQVKQDQAKKKVSLDGLNLEIIDYSQKAIAIIGNTKEIKEGLKAIGGRFNFRLNVNSKKVAGWIFSKTKETEVKNLLSKYKN